MAYGTNLLTFTKTPLQPGTAGEAGEQFQDTPEKSKANRPGTFRRIIIFFIIGANSILIVSAFDTLKKFIICTASECCPIVLLLWVSLSCSAHRNPLRDAAFIGSLRTPNTCDNCNDKRLMCYARITHNSHSLTWKGLIGSGLHKFFGFQGRSSRSLWLGPRSSFRRYSCVKAAKQHSLRSPKTTKTTVDVTHILRTEALFQYVGRSVLRQTEKADVMRMLCIPFRSIWRDQNHSTRVWQ